MYLKLYVHLNVKACSYGMYILSGGCPSPNNHLSVCVCG